MNLFYKLQAYIKSKLIIKNFIWLFISEFFSKGIMFFLAIILARYLGTDGYGRFNFSLSFTALFAILADFGLSTLLIREISRKQEQLDGYLDHLISLKVITSLVSSIILFITATVIDQSTDIKSLIYVFAIYTIASSFNDFLRSIFRSFQKMQYEAYSKFFQSFTLFCLILFFIFQKISLQGIVVIYAIVAVLTIFFNAYFVFKETRKSFTFKVEPRVFKEIIAMSWPFAVSSFFVLIYMKIDVLMLGSLNKDVNAVGIYSAIYNFLYTFAFFPDMVVNTVYPSMSRFYHQKEVRTLKIFYKKLFWIFFGTGALLVLASYVFPRFIISIVFGEAFIGGAGVLSVISLAVFISFISHANLVFMNSVNLEKKYLYSTFGAAILNVALNYYLIPRYSMLGAAWATVISETVGFGYCCYAIYIKNKYELSSSHDIVA